MIGVSALLTALLLNRVEGASQSVARCECETGEGEGDSGVRNVTISLSCLFSIQIKKLAMAA